MNFDPSDAPLLDSKCRACRERRDGTPQPASAAVNFPDGTKRYYCFDHAKEILRFGADPDDLASEPLCVECPGCGKVTLRDDTAINKVCLDCRGEVDEVVPEEELVELGEAVKRGEDTQTDGSNPGGSTEETDTQL